MHNLLPAWAVKKSFTCVVSWYLSIYSISMAPVESIVVILFRWMHIATACVAVGGVFFLRIVIPIALRSLDDAAARTMLLRTRRVFKMVVHSSILLLLISGSYNAWHNWQTYADMKPVGHALFGVHLLLALIVFGISLWLLVGPEPRAGHLKWLAINLGLMFLTIAAASVLKYARDAHSAHAKPMLLEPAKP